MNSLSKSIAKVISPGAKHWVGNGFKVHNLLRPTKDLYELTSPFLLMDYAPPLKFSPSENKLGVGEHPHRGFETVTFALQGEVEHRDSSGGGGVISPGDVQWMTAASGIVHDEFHSKRFSAEGGIFEMVQLWVNLPSVSKMTEPKYQSIKKEMIPSLEIKDGVKLNIIAGKYENELGPSTTYSPINVYTSTLEKNKLLSINLEEGTNTLILVISGKVKIREDIVPSSHLVIFEKEGTNLELSSLEDSTILILNGEPIEEPVVAHGPFVMNSQEEIYQAILDYQSGQMGSLK